MVFNAGNAARVLQTVVLAAVSWGLAWLATGSAAAPDWLPYAFLTALVLAAALIGGTALRPRRRELAVVGALVALAGWEALSIVWSAVPDLARDEALLTIFYAIALLVPLVALRSATERLLALAAIAAAAAVLAVGAGIVLRFGSDQADHFYSGRLSFPISYPNAQAAVFLIGFWPALVLAAQRERGLLVRALAVAAATAIASGWLTAQSKGGIAALAASAAVVFALSPLRLRLLPPTLIAAGLTAAAYSPLTAPFRSESVPEVKRAGSAILLLAALGAVAGLLYALVDRRLELDPRAVRKAGVGVFVMFVAAVVAGVALFFTSVYHQGWFGDQWQAFKRYQSTTASSHLLQLGSYRYDIWRVAVHEFEHHPLAGIGSRGFGPAYLQERRSPDTPARAHSVELDALSELGVVGFALLACALVVPLVTLARRLRGRDAAATAAFAGAVYWLVHASVDWIWTVPACGLPFWLLVGVGCSGGERRQLGSRAALPAAAVAVVIAVIAFVPPWLSARLTDHGNFHWAERLDPLSVDPYVSQGSVAALEEAVRKEPRVVELRFDLGQAYVRAGKRSKARAALEEAHRLDPRDPRIAEALKNAP
ncbi:MAG: O-antigen ligase family protein [Actinobacteria bacterium]|nr:MAG: O-antigen ligase family protein [Actinomycetota bacterium]